MIWPDLRRAGVLRVPSRAAGDIPSTRVYNSYALYGRYELYTRSDGETPAPPIQQGIPIEAAAA